MSLVCDAPKLVGVRTHDDNDSSMSSSTVGTPAKFENATNTSHFGFAFEENSVREIMIVVTWTFFKSPFTKYVPPTRKVPV